MTLIVSELNKTTVFVGVIDGSGNVAFHQSFSGNTTVSFTVEAGTCLVYVSIIEGNGNVWFDDSMLIPEATEILFKDEEVLLGAIRIISKI